MHSLIHEQKGIIPCYFNLLLFANMQRVKDSVSSLINSENIKDGRWILYGLPVVGFWNTSGVPDILIARWKSCWDWPLGLLHLHCSLGQIQFDIGNEDKISGSQIWRAGQAVSDECTGVDEENWVYHELCTSAQWDPPQGSLFPVRIEALVLVDKFMFIWLVARDTTLFTSYDSQNIDLICFMQQPMFGVCTKLNR